MKQMNTLIEFTLINTKAMKIKKSNVGDNTRSLENSLPKSLNTPSPTKESSLPKNSNTPPPPPKSK